MPLRRSNAGVWTAPQQTKISSGRIRHSAEYRGDTFFGVEFVDLPREDRRKIKRYVKERQRADS